MTARAFALGLCLLFLPAPVAAQTIVTSPAPDRVAVTVYRDTRRGPDQAFNLRWLNGYALISETRQVTLPAGEAELRFEGVAGGIVPQSAIVTGLPEEIVERNRDALLLSPGTLLDRSLGRRVMIRRTSPATGAVVETEAVIRSGADGGVVLQTPDGFESLRCTGLPETLVYSEVPAGLSPRPTLSVKVRSRQPVTAAVTLAYLANGFDWQANYIAQLAPDGRHVDLFAWLTLASNDETSFVDASAQAVAGNLNRERVEVEPREGGPLALECWPHATTSDIPLEQWQSMGDRDARGPGTELLVTGSRVRRANIESNTPITVINAEELAVMEELGDLKLYRIPEPVTVAANSQKQVALLQQPGVQVRTVHRMRFYDNVSAYGGPAQRLLVTRNRTEEGLGLPLPAGRLVLFDSAGVRSLVAGQGAVRDHAVGEDVEIELGAAPGVRAVQTPLARTAAAAEYEIVATNDRAVPVAFEAEIVPAAARVRSQTRLSRRNGMALWAVTVPANGTATLRYRLVFGRPRRR